MDLRRIAKAAEEQGWRAEDTSNGIMFYPPNLSYTPVLVHRDPTEQALKKTLSQMKQRGLIWPPNQYKPEGEE